MAGHEFHLRQIGHIPGADNHPAAVGIVFDLVNNVLHLVYHHPAGAFPTAPLLAIHRPQVAIGIGPFVLDADIMILQVFDIRIALQKPQQFVNDALQVCLLGSNQRKSLTEVETHLVAENTAGTGTGAVAFIGPGIDDMLKKIKILLHGCKVS